MVLQHEVLELSVLPATNLSLLFTLSFDKPTLFVLHLSVFLAPFPQLVTESFRISSYQSLQIPPLSSACSSQNAGMYGTVDRGSQDSRKLSTAGLYVGQNQKTAMYTLFLI